MIGCCTPVDTIGPRHAELSAEEMRRFKSVGEDVHVFTPSVILKPSQISFADHVRVDSFTKLEGGEGITFGRWSHVSSFAQVGVGGGKVDIGEGVAIAPGARILSGSNIEDGYYMSSSAPTHLHKILRYHTVIEEGAFLGTNSVVMPGVTVGRFALLGAGSVATKDIPEGEVWMGVPARFLRKRRCANNHR